MKKIAIILGTRPEIIKLSPVIRLLQKQKKPFFIIHTGQHYSYPLDEIFFRDLALPAPRWKFTRSSDLGPNRHDALIQWMKNDCIKGVLEKEKPSAVLVQGDTDTVRAGAEAVSEVGGILLGHVEAGLRSYDDNMPEERNRIIADRLSDFLFAPTDTARKILEKEPLKKDARIKMTGNTIVDAVFQNLELAEKKAAADKRRKLDRYALVTLHRPESVDNRERLENILHALKTLVREGVVDGVQFPVHPRTEKRLMEFGIERSNLIHAKISTPHPTGFLDFLWWEKNADIILTDSGGVQEEACILKVPCVTLRTTTERPETVALGANVLAGYDPSQIAEKTKQMINRSKDWPNPFGDGRSSERILGILNGGTG